MKAWLAGWPDLTFTPASPKELAHFELSHALPELSVSLESASDLDEGYRIRRLSESSFVISGGKTGLLYGAYALIQRFRAGEEIPDLLESSPATPSG